jgi:hypothetical protein
MLSASNSTAGDHAVVGNDATAAASFRGAYDCALEGDALEGSLGCGITRLVQFRRVKIREPNFDPLLGIGRLTNAKTVPVTDVSNDSRKADAGLAR